MLTYKKTQDPNLAYALPNGRYALKNGVPITGDDIAAVLAEYNLEVVEGDAVFVYTGFQHVHDFDKAAFMDGSPGIDYSAAVYLAEKKVVAVGADTFGTEQLMPTNQTRLDALPDYVTNAFNFDVSGVKGDECRSDNGCFGVHVKLLYTEKIYNLENLDLAALVDDRVREGAFSLNAPRSPTPQAHINPVLVGCPDGCSQIPTVPHRPIPQPLRRAKQAETLSTVDYSYLSKFFQRDTKTYNLGQPIGHGSTAYGVRQYIPEVILYTLEDTENPESVAPVTVGEGAVCYNPGISTQMDALTHAGWNGMFINGTVKASDILVEGETFKNVQKDFHNDINTLDNQNGSLFKYPPMMGACYAL